MLAEHNVVFLISEIRGARLTGLKSDKKVSDDDGKKMKSVRISALKLKSISILQ